MFRYIFFLILIAPTLILAGFPDAAAGKTIEIKDVDSWGRMWLYQGDTRVSLKSVKDILQKSQDTEANYEQSIHFKKKKIGFIVPMAITWPIGMAIFGVPIVRNLKREMKYLKLAIEDYNATLQE